MCFPDGARPPDHGLHGEVAGAEDIILTASDGNRFRAHLARPAPATELGIVVLPDVRGLHDYYRGLAVRFAQAGVLAVAIDYFGRTAGLEPRGDDFDYRAHVAQTAPGTVALDVTAGVEHLRSLGAHRVFTMGFCFGGAESWRQSARQLELDGAIGFYGVPARVRDEVSQMKAPLLLLVAGADITPQEEFVAFDTQLTEARVDHRLKVYPGAPHSFFDRSFAEWGDACTDAWRQVLDFTGAVPA